jgi:hypothetical protein
MALRKYHVVAVEHLVNLAYSKLAPDLNPSLSFLLVRYPATHSITQQHQVDHPHQPVEVVRLPLFILQFQHPHHQ